MQGVFIAQLNSRSNAAIGPQRLDGLEVIDRHSIMGTQFMLDENVGHVFLQRLLVKP